VKEKNIMPNANHNDYYYAGGQRIPLVQEAQVFAVRYQKGRNSRDPGLSRRAVRLLRETSENIGFIPNYGLQLYRTNPAVVSRHDNPAAQQQDVIAEVQQLSKDAPVAYASVAYRRNPEVAVSRVDDLMFVTPTFVVQFRAGVSREQIVLLNERYKVRIVEPLNYVENGYLLEAPEADGEHGSVVLSNVYYESDLVVFAHPNFVRRRHLRQIALPGQAISPETGLLRGMPYERTERSIYLEQQWHLETTRVVEAWNITRGSRSIKVAILDDGVDTGHPEFAGKIAAQFDFATHNSDGNPNSSSDNHGTACAGVAVASGVRASGAAPECTLLAVRYPDFLGVVEEADMFRWVADQNADIISCSWGPQDGTGAVDPLPDNVRAAIHYCVTTGRNGRGIPVFWAAGNGNELVSNDGYAANPEVMAVAASSSSEQRAWYSDFGPEIFICAPSSGDSQRGERRIFTTDRRGSHGYNPDADGTAHPHNDHDYTNDFGGTSSATPLVAGVVGLMLSVNPSLRVADVRRILRETADAIDQSGGNYDANGHSRYYGYGRINALRAVERARDTGGDHVPDSASDQPVITAPASILRSAAAPTFQINTGGRRFYAVEVASRAELFDAEHHGHERAADNFYGSWQVELLSDTPYTLPNSIWQRLKQADRLFYRLHVADDTRWANHAVTVSDAQAHNAPRIQIQAAGGASNGGGSNGTTGSSRTVTFPSGATFTVVEQPRDTVDYRDHVGNGVVPLIEVAGRMDEQLSRNFKVRELAASDGARYARISSELVAGLQRIRDRLGAAIVVNSGYRHPSLNAAVDGVSDSQHIAGRAADIRTARLRPLELAQIALEELGCAIGIGLGRNSIHVDLRGQRASWRYAGAELSESEFDEWVRETCRQLDRQRTLRMATADAQLPTIIGPERYAADDEAPTFYIDPTPHPYYAIEIARHPDLFNSQNEAERTSDNFYSSRAHKELREARSATTYTLPEEVWRHLRLSQRLYYRCIAASTATPAWRDVYYSVSDQQAADAPWIELTGNQQSRREQPVIALLNLRMSREADEVRWRG
jgi:subtilisin family serine protease